ncbi:hypothetical protein BH10ACT5_BH10ACT5_00830 [soil metagenome]
MGRPVRRVLSGGVSPVDGHLSRRHVAVPLQRPTRGLGEPRQHPLSGLAPGEVYLAGRVTTTPVVSYTAVSPLPRPEPRRSVLCGTVSRITPGGCYPPPCPVEPGRSSALRGEPRVTRPSSRPIRVAHSSPVTCACSARRSGHSLTAPARPGPSTCAPARPPRDILARAGQDDPGRAFRPVHGRGPGGSSLCGPSTRWQRHPLACSKAAEPTRKTRHGPG